MHEKTEKYEQPKGLITEAIDRQFQNQAMRQNLRERIVSRTVHAVNEGNRAARLRRLTELLEKHPDLCEIIDLMQGLDLL